MKLIEVDFTNELGNPILLTVETVPVEAGKPTHLSIKFQGPTSASENVLTLREVRHLRDALNNCTH